MKLYEDKFKWQIVEETVEFPENGGYEVLLLMTPSNWWTKILSKIKILSPKPMVVEFFGPKGSTYIPTEKEKTNFKGILVTGRGIQMLRVSMMPNSLNSWNLKVKIHRLYS